MRAAHLVVGACVALVATGCADHADPTKLAGPSLATSGSSNYLAVAIHPGLDTISVGASRTLQAKLTNTTRTWVACCMTWASSNAAVIRIDSTGTITPVAPGTATITAVSESQSSGSIEIKVLASAAAPAATFALEVSKVSVASGKTYPVVPAGVKTGAVQYTDRSYTLTSVPSVMAGATLVRTANGDKSASVGSANFLSFDVNQNVIVYVALDPKLPPPEWMSTGWAATGVTLGSTDGSKKFTVHHRSFPKGRVVLGSNSDRSTYYGMYSVAVKGTGLPPEPGDTKAPTVAFTSPTAGTEVDGTVAIAANASDNVKVVGVRFELNGSPIGGEVTAAPFTTSWDATDAKVGTHSLKAIARDAAGNIGTSTVAVTVEAASSELALTNLSVASGKSYPVVAAGMKTGAVQYLDRTYTLSSVPSVMSGATLVRTANGDKSASAGSPTFLSFDVNQPVVVYVALDPKLPVPKWMATGWTNTGVTLGSTDNSKKFHVHHRSFPKGRVVLGSNSDRATNYGMYSVAVKGSGVAPAPGDTKAPTVAFTSPTAGSKVAGTVAIAANASDDVKVVGVRFELNGSPLGSEVTTAPFRTSWDASKAKVGTHSIKAIARDAAGNIGTSTVAVAIAAPAVEPEGPRVGRYVSPTGSASGDGTSSRPWDLATALRQPAGLVAGDTVWMRGGTYKGCYTSELRGTSAKPIVVRQYPGERAIIDNASCNNAALTANGAYTYFWGFEVMSSSPHREGPIGINAFGDYLKFINLVIHDASDSGIGFWAPADGGEIYGTILYNNGRDFNLDHGIYTQNAVGTKRIADNIVFNSWAFGLHVYGSDNAALKGYTIEGNAIFTNGSIGENGVAPNVLVGGGTPAERIVIRDNYLYSNVANSGNMWLGYEVTNKDLTLQDNYIAGGEAALRMWRWTTANVSGNTIFGTMEIANIQGSASGFNFSNNTFYRDAAAKSWVLGTQYLPFSSWQSKVGAGSTNKVVGTRPTGTTVFVRANEYEQGRGHVVIYNWNKTGTVSANVSSILRAGDKYEVRNVQNLFAAPVLSGTYSGGSLSLPMASNGVAAPIGGSAKSPTATGPEFQVFLIVKK